MYNRRGFTVIELLVAVLIIGILTAVALPQYKKAVMSSRFSAVKDAAQALRNAAYVHHLASGEYASDTSLFDIDVPTNASCGIIPGETAYHAYCDDTKDALRYQVSVDGAIAYCVVLSGGLSNPLAIQLCKDDTETETPSSSETTWQAYKYNQP